MPEWAVQLAAACKFSSPDITCGVFAPFLGHDGCLTQEPDNGGMQYAEVGLGRGPQAFTSFNSWPGSGYQVTMCPTAQGY